MTKQEFWEKIKKKKWDDYYSLGGCDIETEYISDAQFVIGCAYDKGLWKVYETTERTGHFIIDEFKDERDAFDMLYELVYSMAKQQARLKGVPFGDEDATWYE